MDTVLVTSKHQITIPSKVRRKLNLHQGDRLSFEVSSEGSYVVRKVTLKKSDGAAKAYLKHDKVPLSDEMIQDAVSKGALSSFRQRNQ